MAANIKFGLPRFLKRRAPLVAPEPTEQSISPPFILVVGSITGASLKDAKLFAQGLAEKFATSPKLTRVQAVPDKARNRILYEIHEGGPGYSILTNLRTRLDSQKNVRVELANGAHVEISDEFGELVTLHYPAGTHDNLGGEFPEEDLTPYVPLSELCSKVVVPDLFPERKSLPVIGAALMVCGALVLLGSALSFALAKAGYFDKDPVTTMGRSTFPPSVADNPYWQLEKAKQAAQRDGSTIGKLTKVDGKWLWVLKPLGGELLAEGKATTPASPPGAPSVRAPTVLNELLGPPPPPTSAKPQEPSVVKKASNELNHPK